MTEYRQRLVDHLITDLIAGLPALSLVGPRASGKTTTALRHAQSVVRLDRPDEKAAMAASPDALLDVLEKPVLIDEWQEVPEVLGAVKRACDASHSPGLFILTGSIRAETQTATWPGTGRVTQLSMYPMTVGEQLGAPEQPLVDRIASEGLRSLGVELHFGDELDVRDYVRWAVRGGFPRPVLEMPEPSRQRWMKTYIHETVTRDSQNAGSDYDTAKLARFFDVYALNSAGITTDHTLYTSSDINRVTAGRYLDLLSRLHVIHELPAWWSNRLKRLTRSPKRFLVDAALLASVTGATERSVMLDGNLLGRMLETLVVSQLRAQASVSEHNCRLYHLRQENGLREIDVVAELDAGALVAFEIKAGNAPTRSDADHLKWLREEIGAQMLAGIVLHTGRGVFPLGERLWALPISSLWTPLPR